MSGAFTDIKYCGSIMPPFKQLFKAFIIPVWD